MTSDFIDINWKQFLSSNLKTFAQLATLLREQFKLTHLKTAERYHFHSAVQKQGQSIADFVHELKKLAGTCTCEFMNE